MGGMRGVGFGALLGLDDFRKDAFATGYHAYLLQRKYPHAEIAFSCPRLRPIINNDRINPMDVHEPQLLQVVCAYRLFMPFASMPSNRRFGRTRLRSPAAAFKVGTVKDCGFFLLYFYVPLIRSPKRWTMTPPPSILLRRAMLSP